MTFLSSGCRCRTIWDNGFCFSDPQFPFLQAGVPGPEAQFFSIISWKATPRAFHPASSSAQGHRRTTCSENHSLPSQAANLWASCLLPSISSPWQAPIPCQEARGRVKWEAFRVTVSSPALVLAFQRSQSLLFWLCLPPSQVTPCPILWLVVVPIILEHLIPQAPWV